MYEYLLRHLPTPTTNDLRPLPSASCEGNEETYAVVARMSCAYSMHKFEVQCPGKNEACQHCACPRPPPTGEGTSEGGAYFRLKRILPRLTNM